MESPTVRGALKALPSCVLQFQAAPLKELFIWPPADLAALAATLSASQWSAFTHAH